MADQRVKLRISFGAGAGHIILQIAPDLIPAGVAHNPDQVQQQAEGHRHFA